MTAICGRVSKALSIPINSKISLSASAHFEQIDKVTKTFHFESWIITGKQISPLDSSVGDKVCGAFSR